MSDESDQSGTIPLDRSLVANIREVISMIDNRIDGWDREIVVVPITVCCGQRAIPLLFVLFEDEESGNLVMSPSIEPSSSLRCSTAALLAEPAFKWLADSARTWAEMFHATYVSSILAEEIQLRSIRH